MPVTRLIRYGMSPREDARDEAQRFAERLKAARKLARMTQEALGAASEVSPVTLSKLESGINTPTLEVLIAIAKALDVSPNYLTGFLEDDVASTSERRLLLGRFQLVSERMSPAVLEQLVGLAEAVVATNAAPKSTPD